MSRITPVSNPQGEAAATLNAIKQKLAWCRICMRLSRIHQRY